MGVEGGCGDSNGPRGTFSTHSHLCTLPHAVPNPDFP